MTYDPTNRKDIRRAEKAAKAEEIARLDYLKAAMTVPQGRAWFHDLLEFCGCFNEMTSFESNRDYYLSGMRNVGLRMFADITAHCPDDYIKMMKEAHGRRIERNVRDNRDDNADDRERSEREDPIWGDQGSDPDPAGDHPTGPVQ